MIICNVLPAWVHGYGKFLKGIECVIRTDWAEYTENVMHLFFWVKNNRYFVHGVFLIC